MSSQTTHLHLIKQAGTETYDYLITNSNLDTLDSEVSSRAKSVNGESPDSSGNIRIDTVPNAENLASNTTQQSEGTFIERTSGGDASISDGDAWLTLMKGKHTHTGYVPQNVSMSVMPIPRTAPAAITAVLDEETFEGYVVGEGTYTLTYEDGWSESPTLYGVTVSNTPIDGDEIVIVWDGETTPVMTVNAVPRETPESISATIDKATFLSQVSSVSGTKTFTFTTAWDEDPASYGITVTGTPIAGDQISVTYQKEVRGSITVTSPLTLISTGWNLYNHANGYAKVKKYSNTYGFAISGTYSALQFSETLTSTKTTITPSSGLFTVPSDGYVWVTGGNTTDTAIWMTWSDWIENHAGSFAAYTESVVDFSTLMSGFFPNGLLEVGDFQDEVNFNTGIATSRVERQAYSTSAVEQAIANGQAYEYDEDYIYVQRLVPLTYVFQIENQYVVNDHGMEMYTGTSLAVETKTVYGQNLKDKLRREVVTYGMTVNELKGMGL